jgi:Lrp/AsnC family leucine-responsive transcriptional regulator
VIEGYAVRLNPAKLGRGLLVFIEITLDRTSTAAFDEFAGAIGRTPEVLECHMVAGGFDYLMKVRVQDMEAYRRFLGETLSRLPGIRQTHTYTVMEEVKNTTELPL